MKKLYIIVLLLMISYASYGQKYYYWYKGEKIPLYKGTQSYILYDF